MCISPTKSLVHTGRRLVCPSRTGPTSDGKGVVHSRMEICTGQLAAAQVQHTHKVKTTAFLCHVRHTPRAPTRAAITREVSVFASTRPYVDWRTTGLGGLREGRPLKVFRSWIRRNNYWTNNNTIHNITIVLII